jgi:putative oxidoreductase
MADDIGKLILRLTLGVLILLHGIAKLRFGLGGIEGLLEAVGMPRWFAYGVLVGEVLAPLLLIAGYYARVGAALVAVTMLFAIGLAHRGDLLALTRTGGWAIELQAMFLAAAIVAMLIGPGRFAVNRR